MTTMTTPHCRICSGPLPPPKRNNGRPREFCSPKCQRIAQRTRDAEYRRRVKLGLIEPRRVIVERAPEIPPRPFSWWVAQTEEIAGTCAKCEGPIVGVYVPPTRATVNECAVVAHCRICGNERMILSGMAGVPNGDHNR